MVQNNERNSSKELLNVARQTIQTTLAQPTEACPRALPLLRYAFSRQSQPDAPLSEAQKEIGLHKAFCGYCAQRFRTLQAALRVTTQTRLLLNALLKKMTDATGTHLLHELGEGLTQTIDATLFSRPRATPMTMGKSKQRVRAQVFDSNGNPLEETTLLIEQGPEVQQGQFLLTLKTADPQHEGATVHVNLILDQDSQLELELNQSRVRKGKAALSADVRALGLAVEPRIPLELIKINLIMIGENI